MRIASCCLAVLASCCARAALACETPAMITIPDGKTSTLDEMRAAQAQVKSYMAAMDVFVACTDEELEAKGKDAPAEYKSLMVKRHNTAVTEMESVAAAFNDQRKAYIDANPAPPAATN